MVQRADHDIVLVHGRLCEIANGLCGQVLEQRAFGRIAREDIFSHGAVGEHRLTIAFARYKTDAITDGVGRGTGSARLLPYTGSCPHQDASRPGARV